MRFVRHLSALGIALALLTASACGAAPAAESTTGETSVPETTAAETTQTASMPSETAKAFVQSGFTAEDLQRENALTNLVSAYSKVRVRSYYNGKPEGETNYFWHDKQIVSAQKNLFEGETYYSGTIGNIHFDKTAAGTLRGEYWIGQAQDELYYENEISAMVFMGKVTEVTDEGDKWAFRVLPKEQDVYETSVCRCVVEKETLALDEVTLTLENGDVVRHTIEHSPMLELDDFGLLDGLDRPFRTVRICTVLHDDAGKETFDSVSVSVPDNIEVIPSYERELALYMNESLSKEYVYPGDGHNYTVYATDAMG